MEQDKELLKQTSVHPSQRSRIHTHTVCARHASSAQCFNLININLLAVSYPSGHT